jgi:hypothetical protein
MVVSRFISETPLTPALPIPWIGCLSTSEKCRAFVQRRACILTTPVGEVDQ